MKKKLLFALIVALAISGCRKPPEPDEPPLPIDPYAAFKEDDTPRWESGITRDISETSHYTFITDAGGNLFSSDKYKIGRITAADGSSYEIIEFNGPPVVGKPSAPSIRKHTLGESVDLYSLEIVKTENGKLWIVFKETTTSPERMVVQ